MPRRAGRVTEEGKMHIPDSSDRADLYLLVYQIILLSQDPKRTTCLDQCRGREHSIV